MGELFSENWKVFPAMFVGAFVLGLFAMLYVRDAIKKWIFNGHGGVCPLVENNKNPLSREDHEEMCEKEWADHNRISEERWLHNQEMAKKDRELLMVEVEYLKTGLNKIFEKLDRR